jgi:hypothetical protein
MNRTLFEHYVKRYNLDVVEKDGEIQSIHFTHKGDKLEMKEITKNEWQATDTNVSFSFTVNDR